MVKSVGSSRPCTFVRNVCECLKIFKLKNTEHGSVDLPELVIIKHSTRGRWVKSFLERLLMLKLVNDKYTVSSGMSLGMVVCDPPPSQVTITPKNYQNTVHQ